MLSLKERLDAGRLARAALASGAMSRASLLAERFWPKVQHGTADECWLWTAALKESGYGQFMINSLSRKPLKAHRISWELAHGSIPDGLHVLHHCDNRRCVNPSHLFLGTNDDNIRDMIAKGRNRMVPAEINRAKTHCPSGHPYDTERRRVDGARQCSICQRNPSWRKVRQAA